MWLKGMPRQCENRQGLSISFFFLEEGLINLNWQDCDILYYMD